MASNFEKVKDYLLELDYRIVSENEEETLFIVEKEESGIVNLMIDCDEPTLVIEQHLFDLNTPDLDVMQRLLMKNREIVHGAFVLDDSGKKVIFRDTLQLQNLDLNELEASINSLELLLSEFANEIIEFSKK